ncbi:histidine kinase [Phytohabitans houttuyneae]|uniref:histidine kinase n=1 Tax=Phytohabitans houttuyneae TaxID=1076126 RepID=A0A6V8KKN1_9ACTN|nr:DUF4118 domain-containing protein [Phytohabitans houttuyneae]GFJ82526.1 hypothetical protein Phou_067060 [Phytohabitans houttuyneae]
MVRPPFWVEVVLATVAGAVAFVLAALACTAARDRLPGAAVALLLLLAVLAVARFAGILYALPVGVVSVQAFDWYYLPPLRVLDAATVFVLALFLAVSVIVGGFATRAARRAVAAQRAHGLLAGEQAALRRVATLVARGVPPAEVFAAVAEEVRQVLGAEAAAVVRHEPGGAATVVAVRGSAWDGAGPAVEAPITVDGRTWGAARVRLPAAPDRGAEDRIAHFTDLVATAISNADARTALTASRARLVTSADVARRRLERDLHDGVQQRLVTLALSVRAAESDPDAPVSAIQDDLSRIVDGLNETLDELRTIARGLHPAILSEAGLGPAVRTLARRSPIPVALDVDMATRPDPAIEAAAYYVVAELLANVAKHAKATTVAVRIKLRDGHLDLRVIDDGAGGADPGRGSGLVGLDDRVEALGGRMLVASPPGQGTDVSVRLPALSPVAAAVEP